MNELSGRPSLAEDRHWTRRLILGDQLGASHYPAWLDHSYACLRENVLQPAYPCFFGTQAERCGEMFYTALSPRQPGALVAPLATFVELGSQQRYRRFNLAAFYEPVDLPQTHAGLADWFWRELRAVHASDQYHDANGPFRQPDDPDWEFCYNGSEMFVVVASPTYRRRRSRCLGPGIVLLFQPRTVFLDLINRRPIALNVRERIRARLRAWDAVAPHQNLGLYGDRSNREWKQYCLPDDDAPVEGACPFRTRMDGQARRFSHAECR